MHFRFYGKRIAVVSAAFIMTGLLNNCDNVSEKPENCKVIWSGKPFIGCEIPTDSLIAPVIIYAVVNEKPFGDSSVIKQVIELTSSFSPLDSNKIYPADSGLHYIAFQLGTAHQDIQYIGGNEALHVARALAIEKNNIWIGSVGGLSCYNTDGSIIYYSQKSGLNYYVIESIARDYRDRLWIGGGDGSLSYIENKKIMSFVTDRNATLSILPTKRGPVWIGKYSGAWLYDDSAKTFSSYSTKQGLTGNFVQSMLEDHLGRVWFATNKGLTCYDSKRKGSGFIQYKKSNGLVSDDLTCISEDKHGNIWFGSNGGGLACVKNDSIMYFSTASGLLSDSISSIIVDRNNNVWVGTQRGISRIDTHIINAINAATCEPSSKLQFMNYPIHGGCIINSICEDALGRIWIGTTHGVIICSSS